MVVVHQELEEEPCLEQEQEQEQERVLPGQADLAQVLTLLHPQGLG